MERGVLFLPPQERDLDNPYRNNPQADLPPVEAVPILRHLGELGLTEFKKEFATPTTLDERGFVDYKQLLSYVDSLVEEDFKWSEIGLDIHHLQWEAKSYSPELFTEYTDPTIPQQFREIPFHLLYIPRQLHNLIHCVTLPPEVPSYDQMKKRVEAFDIARGLFEKAIRSMMIEETVQRAIRHSSGALVDLKRRKLIDLEVLEDRYIEFTIEYYDRLIEASASDLDGIIDAHILDSTRPVSEIVLHLNSTIHITKRNKGLRPELRTAHYEMA